MRDNDKHIDLVLAEFNEKIMTSKWAHPLLGPKQNGGWHMWVMTSTSCWRQQFYKWLSLDDKHRSSLGLTQWKIMTIKMGPPFATTKTKWRRPHVNVCEWWWKHLVDVNNFTNGDLCEQCEPNKMAARTVWAIIREHSNNIDTALLR